MARPEQREIDASFASVPFTDRDIREATRLLALIARSDQEKNYFETPQLHTRQHAQLADREVLLWRARRHLRERQLRKQFFSRAIHGEPAWDTLLVLYISEFSGRRFTIGRLADWIQAPLSTAQRWIAYLEKERLIGKEGHPEDKRIAFLRLLDKGRAILDDYFTAVGD